VQEVIAIIRPNKIRAMKEALDKMGFPGMTAVAVLGRGKQRGIAGELRIDVKPDLLAKDKSAGMKYIPKRMVSIVVNDVDVEKIVKAVIAVNQTAEIGDGRVFVCPVEDALRVRTGETGAKAIV
jgi:nitrogen regulatory protein PII 2